MSKSPLRIWQDILTTLATCKNLAKAAGPQLTGHHAHAEGMHTLLEGVHMYCEELEVTMQQMPKPVWQTLVYTFKVPHTVAQTCCSLLDRSDDVAPAMIDALATFLDAASMLGVLAQQGGPSELAVVVEQQLQAAGLYSHLEQILKQFTQQLPTAPTSAALLRELQNALSRKPSKEKQAALALWQSVQQALIVYTHINSLWPLTGTPGKWLPSIDAAAMELAMQTGRTISRSLDQLPAPGAGAQDDPFDKLSVVMRQACTAVTRCAMRRLAATHDQTPRMMPQPDRFAVLLSSPAFLQALCFALLYSTQAHLAYQEAQGCAAGSSSKTCTRGGSTNSSTPRKQGSGKRFSSKKASKGGSSSKGSSDTSSSQRQQQQQQQDGSSWVRAYHRAQQLQASEQQLLQTLGCSGRSLVWCALDAAEYGVSMPTVHLYSLTMAYKQTTELVTDSVGAMPAASESAQLHQLLPGLLLHWVAALPKYDADGIDCCIMAGTGTRAAVLAVLQQLRVAGLMQTVGEGAPAGWAPGQPEQTFLMLEDILPSLMLMFSRLLLEARRSGSGSGSSIFAGSSGPGTMNEALVLTYCLFMMLGEPYKFVGGTNAFTWRAAAAAAAAGASGSCSVQQPWQPHAAQVAALLESYARLTSVLNLPVYNQQLAFPMIAGLCSVGDRPHPSCLAAAAAAAGYGSPEQLQLCSLLLTMVKLGGSLGPQQQLDAEECRLTAAGVAAAFSRQLALQSGSSSGSGEGLQVSGLLPWLVLFGRCCLQWAVQLQWVYRGIEGLPAAASVSQSQVSSGSTMGRLLVQNTADVFKQPCQAGFEPMFCELVSALQMPLEVPEVSVQLSPAAGVDAGMLLAKAAAATAAVTAAASGAGANAAAMDQQLDEMIVAVRGFGSVLTALPVSCTCNNPTCGNLSETSELKLVKGSSHACSACRTARYCSKECQTKHWKQHKPVCKALVAAALVATELVPMSNVI